MHNQIKTLISISSLILVFVSCNGNKAEIQESKNAFEGLKTDLDELPNSSIDSFDLSTDSFSLKMVDSLEYTQNIEEEMINYYISHRISRSNPNIKRIIIKKKYPNRAHLPHWQMDALVNELEPGLKFFDDSLFNDISEYLLKLPNSRTGSSVLLTLNYEWAKLKNGDLNKSWGENFFEILYPFCLECEKGKSDKVYKSMKQLKDNINNGKYSKEDKEKITFIFGYIFNKCGIKKQ